MITERIRALARDFNPWWEGKSPVVPEYRRHIFAEIEKYIRTKQIIAIVGLRRVGKTILMKQIIKGLAAEKENIFYFLFDDLLVQNPDALEDVLDYYLKTVAKAGKKYIFLDEIQKVPYWQDILKRFYDTREDIKFMVSGSASLQIKKSKESLAGRIFDFYLPILTFREFLELNNIQAGRTELDERSLEKCHDANVNKKHILENMLLQYIYRGAFPEIASQEDDDIVKNYIRSSVIEKIILEDIPAVFPVRKKDVLSSVLEYCSRETSTLLDITNLANILDTNYQTVRSYVFYLKNSFVLDIAYNHSKKSAKQLRKNKKVHIAHPSITIALMGYKRNVLDVGEIAGKFIETAAFQHAKCLSERISFWRTPQKEEVDIIIGADKLLPIEVKYQSHVAPADIKNLVKFMDVFKLKKGILITKNIFEHRKVGGKKITLVPAWLFLLAV